MSAFCLRTFDPWHDSRAIEPLWVVGLGLFGTPTLRSFGRLRDSVQANSDGIWYLPRKGEPIFIAWSNVASVKANDTRQRLVLCNATSGRIDSGTISLRISTAPRTCPESYCPANARASRRRECFPPSRESLSSPAS